MKVEVFPSMKITFPQEAFQVFEFDNGGETDWVVAKDETQALTFLKEFHEEPEDEELLPGATPIKLTKVLNDEELKRYKIIADQDEVTEEDIEESFFQYLENQKLAGPIEVPSYLCGTMFS